MDTDVRDAAAWSDEVGAELERLGDAGGFDRDVGAETVLLRSIGGGFCADAAVVQTAARDEAARAARLWVVAGQEGPTSV